MKHVPWISNFTQHPFYARRGFQVEAGLKRATARVCGLGQFNLYVNGRKAGDHFLDPGWTNYRKVIQYVTFDVTDLLTAGKNALGIEVGNGWYIRDMRGYIMRYPPYKPEMPNPYQPFGTMLLCALELELEYSDGRSVCITTGEDWKTARHPVTLSNVYGSEVYDARLEQKGWSTAAFDDAAWAPARLVPPEECPTGELEEQFQPPIHSQKVYHGVLLSSQNKELIYDLGQNMSGILEFQARGKRGDVIEVLPAEKLAPDGTVDQMAKGWGMVDVKETFILSADGVWETFRMHFTYFAGRYLAVRQAGAAAGETEAALPNIRGLCAHFITNASQNVGQFTCSDVRFEKIYDLVQKAVECNLLSVHTDCPTLERFAWQEPNHLMAPSIMYMKDVRLLWKKFLRDLRIDQCTADEWYSDGNGGRFYPGEGLMPSQAPRFENNVLPSPKLGSFFDIIPWGSTCILGTWWHYQFYGDKQILRDNFDASLKYLEHLKRKQTPEGFIRHGLGDWGNPDPSLLARENIETAFLYADASTLARMARELGREEVQSLSDFAERIRRNYNERLMVRHPQEGYWCYRVYEPQDRIVLSQACQALPLYCGMVDPDRQADVIQALRGVLERDQAFVSGEIGLPYIIQTMARCGMNDLICAFLLREEHPSYYAFVLDGETTLGEFWEHNPRSHCHDMMGHIVEWYYNGIAGILPEAPGFGKVCICPYLPPSMDFFECSYRSIRGEIRVKVTRTGEHTADVEFSVPDGVECRFDPSKLAAQGLAVTPKSM